MKEMFLIVIMVLIAGCGGDNSPADTLIGEWISPCYETIIDSYKVGFCKAQTSFQADGSMIVTESCSNNENCIADEYEIIPRSEFEYVLGEYVETVNGLSAQVIELVYLDPEGGPMPISSNLYPIYYLNKNTLYMGKQNEDGTYSLNMDFPKTRL